MAAFSLGGSLLAAPEDVLEAVLQKTDAAALRQLKAASVAWCNHVRRELCNRLWVPLCRREGQPEPAGVDSITDLDVEFLNEAGRPWEVVVAGRQLPQLERLHGWGFVVDVQAVQEADLEVEAASEDDDGADGAIGDQGYRYEDAPLGGYTLRSCIQGEGQPPDELLLAAVACAASGTVLGVPVQELREDDAIDALDLHDSRIGDTGATLLGLMLPAATSLRSLNLSRNGLGSEGGAALAEGLKGNTTLQSLNLECNNLGDKGGAAIAEGLKGNSMLQSLNLNNNTLCGIYNYTGGGTYTAEGIAKLCEGLKGSCVTSLSLGGNHLCGVGVNLVHFPCPRLIGTYTTEGITKLCKALRGSAVTSLSLANNQLCGLCEGVHGNIHGTYTVEGITKLCEGLKGSAVTSLDLFGNQLCGLGAYGDVYGNDTYTTEGITKLCEGLKGSAVTSLKVFELQHLAHVLARLGFDAARVAGCWR